MTATKSIRFRIVSDLIGLVEIRGEVYGNTYRLVDGKGNNRTLAASSMWDLMRRERLERLCKRLNARDFAQHRQFGEPRNAFAARRAAELLR